MIQANLVKNFTYCFMKLSLLKEYDIKRIFYILLILYFLLAYFKTWYSYDLPPNWISWFDQSEYYKSTLSIINFNFAKENHFYPLGYSLLAVFPSLIFKHHGFALLNLIFYIVIIYSIYSLFQNEIGHLWAAVTSLIIFIYDKSVIFELITPWTNNAVFAFYSLIILIFIKNFYNLKDIINLGFLFFGFIFCRPSDVIYLLPIFLTIYISLFNDKKSQ